MKNDTPPLISTSTDAKNNDNNDAADVDFNPIEVMNIVDAASNNNNNDDVLADGKQKRESEKHKTNKNKKKKCKPEVEKTIRTGNPQKQKGELLGTIVKLNADLTSRCVLQKKLVSTDINVDQCRLQLNAAQVAPLFEKSVLTATEKANIYKDQGLQVKAYDFKGNEYVMELKFLESTGFYRIKKGWGKFLDTHSLKKDQIMVIWVARVNAQPVMMLLNYDEEEDEQRKIDAQIFDEIIVVEGMIKFHNFVTPPVFTV